MRRLFAVCLAVAALSALPASASATTITINFDDGPSSGAVGTFYSGLGVTFSNAGFVAIAGLTGESAPNQIDSISNGFQPPPGAPIVATFSSPVSSVTIRGLDVGANGIELDAYNAAIGGSLIGSDSFFGTDVGVGTFHDLTVSAAGIFRIQFYQPVDVTGDGVVFDNLQFTVADAVPEPTSMLLLGTGIAGVFARRKLRKS